VLDWLFPRQRDRDFVADQFHQPTPRGTQAVLEVLSCAGSRSLLCTFLPVAPSGFPSDHGLVPSASSPELRMPASAERTADTWLILVCEPELFPGAELAAQRLQQQFSRGLSHL